MGSSQSNALSKEEFQTQILNCTREFAAAVDKYSGPVLATPASAGPAIFLDEGISTNDNVVVSILFTGSVYGEYVLAMDYKTALGILRNSGLPEYAATDMKRFRADISDLMREFLNLVVGEAIVSLSRTFDKITVTAPRMYFGEVTYPKIKAGHVPLMTGDGAMLSCYLYIDQMQLDIASSYTEALDSLTVAHEELQIAMRKLQEQQAVLVQSEKMAALGFMASGVAHEINTPLAVVSLSTELIRKIGQVEPLDKTKLFEKLNKIEQTVGRISKVTSGMWALSHGLKKQSLDHATIDSIIDDAMVFCEFQLQEMKIDVRRPKTAGATGIEIDCRRHDLAQTILNLITNARDAVAESEDRWIEIAVSDRGQEIEITVMDSGAGVPTSVRDKIFDPFYTTKEVGKGAGLGLCVAKGVVEEHGGKIEYRLGTKHTCFAIVLPKKRSTPLTSAA